MKEWICKACSATYTPDPPNFSCPECGSGNTIPKDYEPPEPLPTKVAEPEKQCPECGTYMHYGYVVEADSPFSLTTIGEGVYWSPGMGGMIWERLPLKAYACPGCGKIELYARNLKELRALIERAPYISK
jgi:predicted RNA-binding Zn-ribbon protein involved in translation (DUF1610 family)